MKIVHSFPVVLILLLADFSLSQEIDSAKSKWSGEVTFTGLYQSGNTNKFLVQGKGSVKKTSRILETILLLSGSYGENKGTKDDNSYYGSLTVDLYYEDIFSPFLLQYAEYNYSKGIDLRSQTGGGMKYLFIPHKDHKSSVSLALIYDYLNLQDKPGNTKSKEIRFSFRLKTKQIVFDKHMNIGFVGMYQPVVNYFSKANIYIEGNIEVPLTKMFRLNSIYTYTFDNVVSVGRKRADNKLTFGAGFFF
ncbi:MAG TPA: DUF481 domain-containing protein [Ignavibacteria bacterium]|nr:DUF481 domain-containing protein [Ignavibacteria bacterium]